MRGYTPFCCLTGHGSLAKLILDGYQNLERVRLHHFGNRYSQRSAVRIRPKNTINLLEIFQVALPSRTYKSASTNGDRRNRNFWSDDYQTYHANRHKSYSRTALDCIPVYPATLTATTATT